MILLSLFPAAVPAALLLSEEGEHAGKFLGLPLWVWQVLNLSLFFVVLYLLIAKPMAAAFRKRQDAIEERRKQAETQRDHVQRLASELRERTAVVEREIAEIRKQGRADGEEARAALAARADEEAQRIGRDASGEIERHLSAAKEELRRAAAAMTASTAQGILSREITADDRERLLSESVARMKESR